MTQEDKNLILKDICVRLPYGVKVSIDDRHWCDFCKDIPYEITLENSYRILLGVTLGYVKPYLRPMSSMTGVETLEYLSLKESIVASDDITYSFETYKSIDWLNKNMFDYRGLIPMRLANDATDKNIY